MRPASISGSFSRRLSCLERTLPQVLILEELREGGTRVLRGHLERPRGPSKLWVNGLAWEERRGGESCRPNRTIIAYWYSLSIITLNGLFAGRWRKYLLD